jgi:uncharacterized protein YbjQ (UPF0145 family)
MGFFARGGGKDGEQDEALARIEAGGIPRRAEERLKALGRGGSMFTSGLSVNEFALLDRLGPQPLAQVMGASVVRTGWQYLPALDPGLATVTPAMQRGYGPGPTGYQITNRYTEPSISQVRNYQWRWSVVCELEVLTDAWNLARRRALDRLTEEALQVGADAVVGVHLHRSDHDLGSGTIEYVVSGTAIRLPGSGGTSWPTLSDVSVQDYWRLRSVGHEPAGFVASTVAVFASPARATRVRRARSVAQNQELEELSRGFHAARERVRARLAGQVADAHGAGAVGVEFAHDVHRDKFALASSLTGSMRRGWHVGRLGIPYRVSGRSDVERRGWVITMHAAGTAIRPATGAAIDPATGAAARPTGAPGPPIKTQVRM